jgi:hypothetical protein
VSKAADTQLVARYPIVTDVIPKVTLAITKIKKPMYSTAQAYYGQVPVVDVVV